uniref:Uncharacterized protein n=1 Tax=Rhizophora mucronata TaxID=61149 RepID=A0A2P2PH78_RHIMU
MERRGGTFPNERQQL